MFWIGRPRLTRRCRQERKRSKLYVCLGLEGNFPSALTASL